MLKGKAPTLLGGWSTWLARIALVLLTGSPAHVQAQAGLGPRFKVNTTVAGGRYGQPDAGAAANGEFMVVWGGFSAGTDSSGYSVLGRRFDATGSPSGGQFQVNTITTGHQRLARIALDDAGEAIVVWQSVLDIAGQRYDASGTSVGSEFAIAAYAEDELMPSVAVEPAGAAVVVWSSYGSFGTDQSASSIQARRYDAGGIAVGGRFQVNSFGPKPMEKHNTRTPDHRATRKWPASCRIINTPMTRKAIR